MSGNRDRRQKDGTRILTEESKMAEANAEMIDG
jgi:hypothetical protein